MIPPTQKQNKTNKQKRNIEVNLFVYIIVVDIT